MEVSSFSPRIQVSDDSLGRSLLSAVRWLFLGMVFLLPLFALPGFGSLITVKTFLVVYVILIATVLGSLSLLRFGRLTIMRPYLVLSWWGIVAWALIASLLSPSPRLATLGTVIEVHTVGFLVIMGALLTLVQIFSKAKRLVAFMTIGFFGAGFLIAVFHTVRILLGGEALSLGLLNSSVDTLVGGFNDLGLFVGLLILLTLVFLVQMMVINKTQLILANLLLIPSLFILGVVNFYAIWVVLALVSLLLLMYILTKGRLGTKSITSPSLGIFFALALVFVTSTIFVTGGSSLGSSISSYTGISYVEVRPSFIATLDIMQNVYRSDAFIGAGPNHFSDAWDLHKDQNINQTLFWNTDFEAGNGYVTTLFVTTGIIGIVTWVLFFAVLLVEGWRVLIRPSTNDHFWYFTGVMSFVASIYVWTIAWLYVPGPVILMFGALATGIFVIAAGHIRPERNISIDLLLNNKTGLILIAITMFTVIGAIAVGYQVTQQVLAHKEFVKAANGSRLGASAEETTRSVVKSFNYYQSDVYVRQLAEYYLVQLNSLLSSQTEPDEQMKQIIAKSAELAVMSAKSAVSTRDSSAQNWKILGDVYSLLAIAKSPEAKELAIKTYEEAKSRDPKNPYYPLQLAVLAINDNDEVKARNYINEALGLKENYTDALLLLSQIDIAKGDIENAIATTRSLIVLEPNNPGRYYQLGLLSSANKKSDEAIAAFTSAITLNPQFANARYLRALEYITVKNINSALADLEVVQSSNPDNSELKLLIERLRNGEDIYKNNTSSSTGATVTEPDAFDVNPAVAAESALDSDLLTPINTVSKNDPVTSGSVSE